MAGSLTSGLYYEQDQAWAHMSCLKTETESAAGYVENFTCECLLAPYLLPGTYSDYMTCMSAG